MYMRAVTIIMGILLMGTGIWTFANSGVSFLALAFAIGIVMVVDGTVEGMTYIYSRGGNRKDNNAWMLSDSIVTFVIGILVLSGQLAAEVAVPYVFGMGMLFSGVLRLVIVLNIDRTKKKSNFWWTFGTGFICILAGLLGFFNTVTLNLAVGELIGIFFIIQSVTTLELGFHMPHARTIK